MKKTYEKPSVTVIGMETEQAMASLSSWNTTDNPDDSGFDINEGVPYDDGTDLTNRSRNWAKPHNVWE